jgi:hypothetical protein
VRRDLLLSELYHELLLIFKYSYLEDQIQVLMVHHNLDATHIAKASPVDFDPIRISQGIGSPWQSSAFEILSWLTFFLIV